MARKPNDEEIAEAQEQSRKAVRNAKDRFRAKGKAPFRVDTRIGVLPQDVYDRHRNPEDPDFKGEM